MKQDLIFRDYRQADYDIVKTMMLALVYHEGNGCEHGYEMPESKIMKTVQRSLSHPDQLKIKIFQIAETIAGYALLTFYWSNEHGGTVLLLDELYVLPSFRNHGLGSLFITQLSQETDCSAIRLEVFKENTRASQWYRKLGFEVVARDFMEKKL